MKVSAYVIDYTNGERIELVHAFAEVWEMLEEVFKLNYKGIKEEWQDVLVFFQLWLYWRFRVDGEMWSISSESAKKFMERVEVWHDIYEYVGLPRKTSNFCGNYKRPEKVVRQLGKFGVDPIRAKEAFERIVIGV
jgi:hypothetical protein